MKGIILAGGNGTRLSPFTSYISKHLLPVGDKPMIYYSLSLLFLSGIREILLICKKCDQPAFKCLLGDGAKFGVTIDYAIQDEANGLAEAFIIGENFIAGSNVCLVLGDNIFFGPTLSDKLRKASELQDGAMIIACKVKDPKRFGVVELDKTGRPTSLVEKPSIPKSDLAVTGLYYYDVTVSDKAKQVMPSGRGELEITDINSAYLDGGNLNVQVLGRGFTWVDAGTLESLRKIDNTVSVIEQAQGFKIACLEEIAFNRGWISRGELMHAARFYQNTSYGDYLISCGK